MKGFIPFFAAQHPPNFYSSFWLFIRRMLLLLSKVHFGGWLLALWGWDWGEAYQHWLGWSEMLFDYSGISAFAFFFSFYVYYGLRLHNMVRNAAIEELAAIPAERLPSGVSPRAQSRFRRLLQKHHPELVDE